MKKFTARHICLSLTALIAAAFLFTALLFTAVGFDMENMFGSAGSMLEESGYFSENGYDVLDGKSAVLAMFTGLVTDATSILQKTYHMHELQPAVDAAQIIGIAVLALAALGTIGGLACLVSGRGTKLAGVILVFSLIGGLAYLAEGLVLSLAMNKEWERVLKALGESAEGLSADIMMTKAYIPAIVLFGLTILFAVFAAAVKKPAAQPAYAQSAPQNASGQGANAQPAYAQSTYGQPAYAQSAPQSTYGQGVQPAPQGTYGQGTQPAPQNANAQGANADGAYFPLPPMSDEAGLRYLSGLKALLDDGAITEAEFAFMKENYFRTKR